MEIENIEEKEITGFSIRTTNEKEMNPVTGKIAALHQKFDNNVEVDYKSGNRIYGIYHDYESDACGEYTVLAGTDQANIDSAEALESIVIQAGKYLVFHAMGEVPQVVIDTWGKIWQFFSQQDADYKRLYTTDFEYYVSQSEVKIYIAVE